MPVSVCLVMRYGDEEIGFEMRERFAYRALVICMKKSMRERGIHLGLGRTVICQAGH